MVNKKPAGKRAPCCGAERLERLDVRRLKAFGAALHFKLDLLALLQRLEAVHLDRSVMREQIFAAFSRGDEAEAFGVVEPLDGTGRHLLLPSTGSRDKSGRDHAGHDDQGNCRPLRTTLLAAGEGYKFAARYPAGGMVSINTTKCQPGRGTMPR